MSVRRLSKTFISGAGAAAEKSSSFLAGYSPAIDEMDLIERVVVGAGGTSAIEFTLIPQTYQHLQVRMIGRSTASTQVTTAYIRLNGDTGSNYAQHLIYGNGVNAYAASAASQSGGSYSTLAGDTATTSVFGASVIDILDYTNTSKNTTMRSMGGVDVNGATGYVQINSNLWISTSVVTSVTLYWVSSNFSEFSTAALYGVKA